MSNTDQNELEKTSKNKSDDKSKLGAKPKKKSKIVAKVDQDVCVACGACVKECRFGAITIVQGIYAEIDVEKCVGCKKCAKICPASVIEMVSREEVENGKK